MIDFISRYGWLSFGAAIVGIMFLAAYPLPVLTLGLLGYGIYWVSMTLEKRHVTRQQLQARADYEHWLWMHGDSRGFYGQYPPIHLPPRHL